MNNQRIAWLRAVDGERPNLAWPFSAGALVSLAPKRFALKRVAGLHGKDRRASGKRRMADRGLKAMRRLARGDWNQRRKTQNKYQNIVY